jgi:hypothetical protein
LWEAQARVEELVSDDDTDTQGVGLNFDKKRFASDPLQFTGIDLTPASRARKPYNYNDSDSSEDSESGIEVEGTNALQVALRDKEEALVRSALARIRRAQEKGKREVKLNQDELDALEKRRKRMQAAATATNERKGSASSGGSESERRRRSDRHLVTIPIAEPTSRKRAKSVRHEEAAPHPPAAANPPGMLVAGTDGLIYAPLGHYTQAGSSRNSPTRPRSATSQQLRGPPPQMAYQQSFNRHFSEGYRPVSSSSTSSRRPLPDEDNWIPSRRSSGSSQSHGVDPFEYQISSDTPPPIPQQYMQSQGQSSRRNVSGPPEIIYSTVRRSPPINTPYPAAARASDTDLRRRSMRREAMAEASGSSSEEDESDDLGNGVQVFVEEREHERERERVPRKPVGGGRKKGKGR